MKVLLSAYACEPNKGSEPAVGWNWALALTRRGYDVHVITRSNNRVPIKQAHIQPDSRLTFHYCDLPRWLRFWKHWPGGIYVYYLLWQIGAYRKAKRLHATERFDIVQHITFVSYRQPSFMGGLGVPFIFGPVGGGEAMPRQFRKSLPLPGKLAESLRDTGNRLIKFDPWMRSTYARAQVIACTTGETLAAIPGRFRNKCIVQRAIGIDRPDCSAAAPEVQRTSKPVQPRYLFVGRLLYWKGLHLVLRAMEQVKAEIPDIKLRVIGEGKDRRWLEHVALCAHVADIVEWVAGKPHNEMDIEYRDSMGLIFPSLHDSGGMVVLEALAARLPVICLDLGGPGSIVDSSCGFSLKVGSKSEREIIEELALSILRLAREKDLRNCLAQGARNRARELTWDEAVDGIYSEQLMADKIAEAYPINI
ncbi:MAG: glycosyltransferase family 4 protein [Terracidiphilus sp.]